MTSGAPLQGRLIVVAGPLDGKEFPVDGSVTIGRESDNVVAVNDRALSRHHIVIEPDGERFQLRDLGSKNGTLVNGLPVTARFLEPGDQIVAGGSVFLFQTGRNSAPAVRFGDDDSVSATAIFRLPSTVLGRSAKQLETMLEIADAISSIRDRDELQSHLLRHVLSIIPAERGVIVTGAADSPDFTSVFQWDPGGKDSGAPVSRTLLRRAMEARTGLILNDADRAESADSLLLSQTQSVMIAPLMVVDQTLGAIYLDSRVSRTAFTEQDLELLTGIAAIAAAPLRNAFELEDLQRENERLRADLNLEQGLVGTAKSMKDVFGLIARVAPGTSTVLIRGESGVGKELVARTIHRNSPRARKPFVAINCAGLNNELLQSELFGHERGAFTGAITQKKGKFEEAAGGTVFLDELGEMDPGAQAKLLRAVQERVIERVGGTKPIPVDIRIVAATNKDLQAAVSEGSFRKDLFFRLNVIPIDVPPLRERPEDILPLAQHFIRKKTAVTARKVNGLSDEARNLLVHHAWPGNVRELENAIEWAMVTGSSPLILPEDLPRDLTGISGTEPVSAGFAGLVQEAKKKIVLDALRACGNNYTQAAKMLDLLPSNLHRLIRSLGIRGEIGK